MSLPPPDPAAPASRPTRPRNLHARTQDHYGHSRISFPGIGLPPRFRALTKTFATQTPGTQEALVATAWPVLVVWTDLYLADVDHELLYGPAVDGIDDDTTDDQYGFGRMDHEGMSPSSTK